MDRFIFMLEWDAPVQYLTNEEKGILFQNLLNNAQGLSLDETNRAVNIAWGFIKPNLDRMTDKWLKDFENGKKGGAPKGSIPWNKKRTQSEPPANPKHTHTEGERTYKEKENYKENYKDKETIKNNKIQNIELSNRTNTHTREVEPVSLFELTPELQKEANRQAEFELQKLINKKTYDTN